MNRIYRYFSNPKKLAVLNSVLIGIILALNIYLQVFCIPTTWVIITIAICFLTMVFYPIFEQTKFAPLTSFINGVTFCIFIYCIIFLEYMSLVGFVTLLVGVGFIILIPHFFAIQLLWKNLIRPKTKTARTYFLLAVALCLGTVFYIGQSYKQAIRSIDTFKNSNYTILGKSFMTEKILGMHFIYHTKIDLYDGWRPPKHEPILIIGMWLNNRFDPLNVDLPTRLKLYKKFFPENKYKFDCSCGIIYNENYHNDNLWK